MKIYSEYKIYGPYTGKDGRKRVVLYDGRIRKTVSYPKYLMECYLNRILDQNLETIDHIDRDFTNDNISNLRIIERSKHSKEDALYREKIVDLKCVWCKIEFKGNCQKRTKIFSRQGASPFCSKSCSGRYGAALQNNRIKKLDNCLPKPKHYKMKKI